MKTPKYHITYVGLLEKEKPAPEEFLLVSFPQTNEFGLKKSKYCRIAKTTPPKIKIKQRTGYHEFEILRRGKSFKQIYLS
jgi:hypothetical protein